MASKSASIQYRYVNLDALWDGFHLKDMVVDILRRAPPDGTAPLAGMARLRKKDLDQDGSFVVLNKLSVPATWDGPVFCGQLLHVKNGAQLPGINGTLDDDAPEFELQHLTFEQRTRIVEGVLYFAVTGNHVGIIEGQRTRGRTLERYLTMLLQDAGEMEPGQAIVLNARLLGAVSEVSEIEVQPRKSRAPAGDAVVAEDAAEEEGAGATVLEVLRLLGWPEEQILRLQEQIPEGGWLEGRFRAIMKKRSRGRASVSRESLEQALRNLDGRSVRLFGEGARESGGLIKLSDRCKVDAEGDLLEPSDAMAKIVAALRRWSEAGKIDCTFE